MSGIPPKHTPEPPPYEAPESGGGMVAMYNAASHANAESFPVLKAFQDYLEAEREQARKRVTHLSILFAVLMGVVVTGFLSAGIFMLRNMTSMQNKLLDVALATKNTPPPAAPAANSEQGQQLTRLASELQANLGQKMDGVSAMASQMSDKVASQSSELETLRGELRRMQEQSTKLNDELNAVKTGVRRPLTAAQPYVPAAVPSPTHPLPSPVSAVRTQIPIAEQRAAAPAPQAPAAVPPPPAQETPKSPAATKEPPATPSGVTAPAAPQGMMATAVPLKAKSGNTIPWRVFIPE
jgi:hypothetical protein